LGVVHPVSLLPARRRRPDQADPVEDAEVLGHRLPGDRQLPAQRGGRAVALGQQQVEQPAPRRVPDRRPELVVDPLGHRRAHGRRASVATYDGSRGR
jgi:hypothetical protein